MTHHLRVLPVLGVLVAALLFGCTSESAQVVADDPIPDESSLQVEIPQEAQVADDTGTGGVLIPIDSDNVAMAGYDNQTRIMTVMFHQGRIYEYYNIPPTLWEAFFAAQPDPWSLVGYPQLVQGGYAYQEITP